MAGSIFTAAWVATRPSRTDPDHGRSSTASGSADSPRDGTAYGLARLVPGARSSAVPLQRRWTRHLRAYHQRPSHEFTIAAPATSSPAPGRHPTAVGFDSGFRSNPVYDAQIGHPSPSMHFRQSAQRWQRPGPSITDDPFRPRCLPRNASALLTPRDYNRFSAMLSGPTSASHLFMGRTELQADTI